jgi:hypothetical protein
MNTTQNALPQPDMPWRRNRSISAVIAIQMKITHAKKTSMSQRIPRKG